LIIDTDRVTTIPVTSKRFKPVPQRYTQVFQLRRKRAGCAGTPGIEKILGQAIPE